jgi:hypothetical protein
MAIANDGDEQITIFAAASDKTFIRVEGDHITFRQMNLHRIFVAKHSLRDLARDPLLNARFHDEYGAAWLGTRQGSSGIRGA